MPRIDLETAIQAPIERCFDLARDLDLHLRSMQRSGEQAVAGKTSGLIGFGEEVTWRAKHFGLWHQHSSRITAFDFPRHFRDSMVQGRFRRFEHDHFFETTSPGVTSMRDVVDFASPLGFVGAAVDALFMRAYLSRLILLRNRIIREAAEARASPECP